LIRPNLTSLLRQKPENMPKLNKKRLTWLMIFYNSLETWTRLATFNSKVTLTELSVSNRAFKVLAMVIFAHFSSKWPPWIRDKTKLTERSLTSLSMRELVCES